MKGQVTSTLLLIRFCLLWHGRGKSDFVGRKEGHLVILQMFRYCIEWSHQRIFTVDCLEPEQNLAGYRLTCDLISGKVFPGHGEE